MSEDTSLKPLYPLIPAQLAAVQPEENVWLSASAGTGKTQVLTARVIRLLLEEGVDGVADLDRYFGQMAVTGLDTLAMFDFD